MNINIQRDVATLQQYVSGENFKTTGLLRGPDGVLRQVAIISESTRSAILSDIIKELFKNPTVFTLTKKEFLQLINIANSFAIEDGIVKESIIQRITAKKLDLWDTGDQFLNDKQVVLAAVRKNGAALEHASAELKNDEEVVLAAVQQNNWAFRYANSVLRNKKDFMLTAVRYNGWALEYASYALINDKDVVLAAVKHSGTALQHASDELKNDKEVVLAAVTQNGWALQFASTKFKEDKEVVLAALRQNGLVLQGVCDELKSDKEVVLSAVRQNGAALRFATTQFKEDKEIVLVAVWQNGNALQDASDELKNDKEVVLAAVTQNGDALQEASDQLKNDREVVLAAARQNGLVLLYASEELQCDKKIILSSLRQNGRVFALSAKNDPFIGLAFQIYNNQPIDIENISIQNIFKAFFPHLNNHTKLPVYAKIIEIFDDSKLHDFEKRQLLKSLFDLIGALKDEVIQSNFAADIIQAIFTLENPFGRRVLIDEFNNLSLSELQKISQQNKITNKTRFELRTKVLLSRLNSVIGRSEFTQNIAEKLFIKDTKKQVILFSYLIMIIDIYSQLNDSQKNKLILGLHTDLNILLQPNFITKFKLLMSMKAIFGKDVMIEASNKPLAEIEAYFAKKFNHLFQGKSMVQDSELLSQVTARYQETFAQFREPMAIFTYLKSVIQVVPVVHEALSEYVYHVLKEDFDQFRNEQVEDQPHLAKLYQNEEIKKLWLSQIERGELTDSGVVKALDMIQFFHQKVVIDNHFQDEDRNQPNVLKQYLAEAAKNANIDHRPYLQMLEENENSLRDKTLLARNRLEVLIIKFCAKDIDKETLIKEREALYRDRSVQIVDVEKALSNDFELLSQQPSVTTAEAKYTLQFTTDPSDLLLLGTEVQGSCQNINGQPSLNKCLLAYMINGESQAIVIKDINKRIVGRGVVRLLLDDQGNPALFLERLYLNKYLDSWKEAIIYMAKEKAKAMGIPLLSTEVGQGDTFNGTLHFSGGRAPFIYSDASGGVFNGQQGFIITSAHILFKP